MITDPDPDPDSDPDPLWYLRLPWIIIANAGMLCISSDNLIYTNVASDH